jgi:HK97 family phage major capsid protein
MHTNTFNAVGFAAFADNVRRHSLNAAATTFGGIDTGEDGGFAVPSDVASAVLMSAPSALLPLCLHLPLSGGSIDVPTDMATPYGSGVVAGFDSEGLMLDQQKPHLNMSSFKLKKLTALVPVSDEILADSALLAAWLPLALQAAATLKMNEVIVAGTGAGLPLGILNSDALITVPTAGQAAGSIDDTNVEAMLARSLNPLSSTWIANPAAYGQIINMTAWEGATKTLAGLPVVLTDACPQMGATGDLILADLSLYVAATKAAQIAQSVHLWFDQDLTAFKLVFRMDGAPALSAPVTPPNATATKSPFVVLAERV